ncbi:phosphoribosylamine--glycine ligase, partial [Candidatus Woesearchaeota archaeon]|nr:phosphoribosylamine--glycine ligase [Candidatus Woesearchaeota archaeon]
NTGGMGSYSCEDHLLPFLTEEEMEKAHGYNKKTIATIEKETGQQYKGILYGGFMATKNGVKIVEYNARFGDPETMNALPILETDFFEIVQAICNGTLKEIKTKITFANKATVCKYVVPEGYPDNPTKNEKIALGLVPQNVKAYFAAVDEREDGLYMTGSRAMAFTGIAESLEEAEKAAEFAASQVKGRVFHRRDIGTKELVEKRIRFMQLLRG